MLSSLLARKSLRIAAAFALLSAALLVVYGPALNGGILWDDPGHMIPADMASLHGLFRIWFEPGATPQYYPLLYSAFWLERQLWGDGTLGYHLVIVLQHAGVVLMIWMILRRLAVPGAWLAAALFAIHPVQVESVAWISEQKNTLSGLFYFGALWCYLEFDAHRKRTWYAAALVLFILGILSKTAIVPLPAVLLLIFWWQRGKLELRRDVLPTVPFFVAAILGGLMTVWMEYTVVGSGGAEYHMTILARCLLAGRVTWFYLSTLVWPSGLMLFYPRWTVDPAIWWQWVLSWSALLALIAGLWAVRKRTRAPLTALLYFVGTLVPVIGFVNVYFFHFSYVADHFQYLSCVGVFVLFAAGVTTLGARLRGPTDRVIPAMCIVLILVLAALSWRLSRNYGADDVALYNAVIEKDPASWAAHENLAAALLAKGDLGGATHEADEALRYRPQYPWALSTIGEVLRVQGHGEEARAKFEEALRIDPNLAQIQFELANVLHELGHPVEAITAYQRTIRLQPKLAEAHFNLGGTYLEQGDLTEASTQFVQAELTGHYSRGKCSAAWSRPLTWWAIRRERTEPRHAPRNWVRTRADARVMEPGRRDER